MGEQDPSINTAVYETFSMDQYTGTVSEPTFDNDFQDRLSEYTISVARRHPGFPDLQDQDVSEFSAMTAIIESQILERFAAQYNIINYFDIGAEYLATERGIEAEVAYDTAWIRFIFALGLEPRSRAASWYDL